MNALTTATEMSFSFFDYFRLFFKTDGGQFPTIPITVVCCPPPLPLARFYGTICCSSFCLDMFQSRE
jgi:hypothetical protein